jgi:hypothetical protein
MNKHLKPLGIDFAEDRWMVQFFDDTQFDPRCRMRMLELGLLAFIYGKVLIITGIIRTKEKNIEIYGKDEPSGHRELPSRAIDFEVDEPDSEFCARMKNHHSMYMDRGSYYTLMNHDVGAGLHWHLQVPFDPRINKKPAYNVNEFLEKQ